MAWENFMNHALVTLKQSFGMGENIVTSLVSKLNEVFPPQIRQEQIQHYAKICVDMLKQSVEMGPEIAKGLVAKSYVKPALVLLFFISFYGYCCGGKGGGGSGKMMKAPGRNSRIRRDAFERNPKAYFRNLRNK